MNNSCKDLSVRITIRNNRILWRIKKMGFKSIAEFCRVNCLPQREVNGLITFYRSPLGKRDWIPLAYMLSSALRCEPEDLWPEQLKRLRRKQTAEFEIDAPEVAKLADVPTTIDAKSYEKLMLSLLPRERFTVEEHMAGATFDEIGKKLNVGLERVRQIEAKAFRKMRHPSRLVYLASVADSLDIPSPVLEHEEAKIMSWRAAQRQLRGD